MDNSNVVPLRYVDCVLVLAKENGGQAQYGLTGGANDGAVFLPVWLGGCGTGQAAALFAFVGKVIDTKGLDASNKIVEVLAWKW